MLFEELKARMRASGAILDIAAAAIVFALFAFRSFVLYVDIVNPVGMEECHTGAIVREMLQNGFQFPIEQYTPEYYENSIIVGALLTLIPASLMGVSRLSLEITPFILSFSTLMIFCSLLKRAGYASGIWFFVVSYFFVSGTFVYQTMDSVGNHVIGLFIGSLILWFFYIGLITKSRKCFYGFMTMIGIGLFAHMGSLLYAGLCVIVYVFYKSPECRKPRLSASVAVKGVLLLLAASSPFFIFMKKTGMMSAVYLLGVIERRSTNVQNWGGYAKSSLEQLLFQFDDRALLMAFYFVMAALSWAVWRSVRGGGVSQPKRLLCYIAALFPLPILAAVVIFSGGQFTTYHVYLMTPLFMAGAVSVSTAADKLLPSLFKSSIARWSLSAVLLLALLPGSHAGKYNSSTTYAMEQLTSEEELSYCYWRFGRSFGNYVEFKGDAAVYAGEAKKMCERFDAKEKTNECLWGWSSEASQGGFILDARAAESIGRETSELLAASVGGWSQSILACFNVHEPFVDDCFLGYVERKAIMLASIKTTEKPEISIRCHPESPRFSGLMEILRQQLREGSLEDGPQVCSDNLNPICIHADAYCAAIEKRMDFCDTSYESKADSDMCRFVFQHVWMAKEAEYSFEF